MSYISFRDWKTLSVHPAVNGELLEYGHARLSGTHALTIVGRLHQDSTGSDNIMYII